MKPSGHPLQDVVKRYCETKKEADRFEALASAHLSEMDKLLACPGACGELERRDAFDVACQKGSLDVVAIIRHVHLPKFQSDFLLSLIETVWSVRDRRRQRRSKPLAAEHDRKKKSSFSSQTNYLPLKGGQEEDLSVSKLCLSLSFFA